MEYYLAKGILSYDLIQISNTNGILSDKWNIIMQMESYYMMEYKYQIQMEYYLASGILSYGPNGIQWHTKDCSYFQEGKNALFPSLL